MNTQTLNPMVTFLAFLCGTLLISFLVLFLFFHIPLQDENKRIKRDLAYYDSTYLQKQGWTSMMGGDKGIDYDLRSWDAGQTWYAVKATPQTRFAFRKLIILGEADTIYPNLLQHLEGWDKLTEYVSKNGSIGGKHPINEDDIKMLQDAGFEVKHNKN